MVTITPEIAAIPLSERAQCLAQMRAILRIMWQTHDVENLRGAQSHFQSLDWLVRYGHNGTDRSTESPVRRGDAEAD